MILYAASAIYHAVRVPLEQLRYFLLVDLSAIYVLIAGTYTPVILLLPKGWRRMAFFATIWLIAAVGIAFKVMVVADVMSPPVYWVSALFYLGMGWLGLGMILDIVLGVIGGLVGGWLFSFFGAEGVTGFNIYSMFVAVIGAIVVLVVYHAIAGQRAVR